MTGDTSGFPGPPGGPPRTSSRDGRPLPRPSGDPDPVRPDLVTTEPVPVTSASRTPVALPAWLARSVVWFAAAVLLLLIALGGAAAAVRHQSGPVRYTAAAVLLIDQEPALSQARDQGVIVKLSTLRLKYVEEVGTRAFTQPLAAGLGLPIDSVAGAVAADAPSGSLLVTVSASARDGRGAERLAAAAAAALRTAVAAEQDAVGVHGNDQVTLTVVTPADTAARVGPSGKRTAALAVLALAALAGAAACGATGRRYR